MSRIYPALQPAPYLTYSYGNAQLPHAGLRWRLPSTTLPPPVLQSWLTDQGSLTKRLQSLGCFQVAPQHQAIEQPRPDEVRLLGMSHRRHALIREVLLLLDGTPVVFARSVLPLASIKGANRVLGHMARRSLGAELFKPPKAQRHAVWYGHYPQHLLPGNAQLAGSIPSNNDDRIWGRQSRFLKRGKSLLVAEVFLPSLLDFK